MSAGRFFAAINPPEPTQKALGDLNPHIPRLRWTLQNQMHLTLGFFGDVSAEAEALLREKLDAIEFRAFFLPIRGIGTFPPKSSPKILWIGVGSGHPHLFQIHKRIQEAAIAAGVEPDLRPWHPHITLGRCQEVGAGDVSRFVKQHVDLDLGMIRVEAFHLYRSELTPAGPIHSCELTIPAQL